MTQMILRSLKMLRASQRWFDCSPIVFSTFNDIDGVHVLLLILNIFFVPIGDQAQNGRGLGGGNVNSQPRGRMWKPNQTT